MPDLDAQTAVTRVRPTLRCLIEDLSADVGPAELRRSLATAQADIARDPTFMLGMQLADIDHPVLRKAQKVAAKPESGVQLQAISDKHVYRIKTGAHRGALWQDETGQWWLLAAGRRRNDDAGDFYREVHRFGSDSSEISPTQVDVNYNLLESSYRDECNADRKIHEEVLRALLASARSTGVPETMEAFGATVSITIHPDEADLAVLEVTWKMASFEDLKRFPADLLAMIPAGETTDDWSYLAPPPGSEMDQLWWTYVPQSWVESLAVAAELDDLIDSDPHADPPDPVTNGSEEFSHWAKGSVVTRSYIEGIEIVGICGARVVAHRDFEGFPVCPRCDSAVELLRRLRAEARPGFDN